MASRYFAAGKIRAGWFHGRKLSQHKQERDVDCPAPLASQRGSDAQVWGCAQGAAPSPPNTAACGIAVRFSLSHISASWTHPPRQTMMCARPLIAGAGKFGGEVINGSGDICSLRSHKRRWNRTSGQASPRQKQVSRPDGQVGT